ncbi:MAG: hypothetical protein NUW37_10850 [Planctomycetes bacterium]|nr:hypothetical protein [Planctomycetota bacterium]
MKHNLFATSLFLILAVMAPVTRASSTSVVVHSSRTDFEGGEAENVVITSEGNVVVGRAFERTRSADDNLWSVELVGEDTFFGTGPVGKLLKKTTAGFDVEFDSPEILLPDLVAGNDGTLYIASIPNGRVFVRSPQGMVSDLVTLDDKYVWSLAFSADKTKLYAGTGPAGSVYEIDVARKTSQRIFRSEEPTHVLDVVVSESGTIYAGSASDGRIYRIKKGEEGFASELISVLPKQEVRALALAGDVLYAAANKAEQGAPRNFTVRTLPGGQIVPPGQAGAEPLPATGFSTAVYAIEKTGVTREIFALKENYVTTLASTASKTLLIATGKSGQVYEYIDASKVQVLFDFEEEQVLDLLVSRGELEGLTTGKTGAYISLGGIASEGKYTSAVIDAGSPATFGRLDVVAFHPERADSQLITVETRTGNSEKPDATWSAWKKIGGFPSKDDDAFVSGQHGRYFQYRVNLTGGKEAFVIRVSAFYLADNRAPEISSLQVEGAVFASGPVRRTERTEEVAVKWQASDPDGDELAAYLHYRIRGDTDWIEIENGDPVTSPYKFATEGLPSEVYEVRLTVVDEKSNSPARALKSQRLTPAFIVDHDAPEVESLRISEEGVIRFSATDAGSFVAYVEYSIDREEYRGLDPADLIYDEATEEFSFKPTAQSGSHVVAIRIYDAASNQTIVRRQYDVK